MRKLSKKISMLMVLAMLVSLFSGIVSASAAAPSSWSFKSSKYDVAVGETIEMEKNEYADFDLFRYDAAPEGYTVKWSSSDVDTVYVNGKTGQLRADKYGKADFGDKATISATFTNTATGKSATRSFVIVVAEKAEYEIAVNFGDEVLAVGQKYDLAAVVKADGKEVEAKVEFAIDGKAIDAAYTPAAEGEFTIVTTATIDGKVVAEVETAVVVVEAGLESAKQTAYNAVALTFGSADVAKAVAADASKLNAVWLAGENEINAFIKAAKVDEKKANVVNVELYNNIAKDTTYKFTYADKSATIVGADLTKYASIAIATTAVPAVEYAEVKVNFYDANGVLVDVKTTGFSLSADASGDYYIDAATNKIYFYDQYSSKSAVVTATYFMGYDDNGNKIDDLKSTATITSYNKQATEATNINGWAVDGRDKAGAGLNYGGNSANLAVGDAVQLYFKYDVTDINGVPTTHYSSNPYSYFGGFEYSTTNEGVLLVDVANGYLYPVAAGSAQIVVKSIASYDANVKNVIGVFNVNVVGSKNLTSIAPSLSKTKLAAEYKVGDVWQLTGDSIRLMPNAKDQFGVSFAPDQYKIELVYADADVTVQIDGENLRVDESGAGDIFEPDYDDNGAQYFDIKATKARDDYAKNVQIAITAYQWQPYKEITRVVNFSVKDAGAITTYSLDGLTTSFDLNITDKPAWAWGRWYFETQIKLAGYDQQGYFVQMLPLDQGAAGNEAYYYQIFKDGSLVTGKTDNDDNSLDPSKWDQYANNNAGAWTFYAMNADWQYVETLDEETGEAILRTSTLTKLLSGTGTYVVKVYKKDAGSGVGREITQKAIVVKDSSVAISVIQKDNKLFKSTIDEKVASGATMKVVIMEELQNDLTLKRNGKDVNLAIVDVEYTETADGQRIYINKIKVCDKIKGFVSVYWKKNPDGSWNTDCEDADYIREVNVGKVFEVDFTK